MTWEPIAFGSGAHTCRGWRARGEGEDFLTDAGRPCVVMAHGLGGTVDSGLGGFIDGFAEAGLDVVAFDYRGFAESGGSPRQVVSYRRQREDYHAAIAYARRLRGVDPARVVLWGTSYSGGHVVACGAQDRSIAAGISLTPAMDGVAALATLVRRSGVSPLLKLTAHGLRDVARSRRGGEAHRVPLAAAPGTLGFLDAPGALEGYRAVAGPTWRNEISARTALEVAANRPIHYARKVGFPLLVQVGENDQTVPGGPARKVARSAPRGELRTYPLDHFDVYAGPGQDKVLADQVEWLRTQL